MTEIRQLYQDSEITEQAKRLFEEERSKKRLDGWFLVKEAGYRLQKELKEEPKELRAARILTEVIRTIPLSISEHAVFAGTQSDSFARTYALINPAFQVETFSGYCDPTAVFSDIEPNEEFTEERIAAVKAYTQDTPYIKKLTEVYDQNQIYSEEIAFFVEQVTGHVIPDFRPALKKGVRALIGEIDEKLLIENNEKKRISYQAMKLTLEGVITLAHRYAEIAKKQQGHCSQQRIEQLKYLERTLHKVPEYGADSLYEAMQSYLLLWQVMCLEQAPNPYAFSVGNADRIFEPYRAKENLDRETAACLFTHFLVFYNVGDRSWAISQNVIVGGRDNDGKDLTNLMSYAIMDAYYEMNLPQPILSVKLHKHTPDELYEYMGRFFFTPGCLTPSLFNDDSVFTVLQKSGIEHEDLPDYAIAGCQEPLIMGKDNGNTTNSWLNLAKILELTINHGRSLITGKQIGPSDDGSTLNTLSDIRNRFYQNVEFYADHMTEAANQASLAISYEAVPFLSVFMGGIETGVDMRDTQEQGTKYNGSGCLIHGLSVVADSFAAIDRLINDRPQDADRLLIALQNNFEQDEELRRELLDAPKFGNGIPSVDKEAAQIADKISDLITSKKNYLGNRFRADWSSPSTHLLYGYQTGATPDGRKAREMLGYGVDPLFGEASQGLGFRILSAMRLPYEKFNGGCAAHYGIDPKFFTAKTMEEKGLQFKNRVLEPTFFNKQNEKLAPFYLYMNITTPETLRKVMEHPKKYAPSGVYIMRIHGTFVNFLDLSPAIQMDIIKRLDLQSTGI
ncbi:MAG: pyruvate formate lyase family protein [Lachnospiraceae bacterium]